MPVNIVYGKAKQLFLNGDLSWRDHAFRVVLVDVGGYSVNAPVDGFLSDLPAPARIATSGVLTGKTNVLGVLDAADVPLYSVTGNSVEAVVIYRDTGVAGTSVLVAYMETFTINGGPAPFVPNGSDVVIHWSDGASKILAM